MKWRRTGPAGSSIADDLEELEMAASLSSTCFNPRPASQMQPAREWEPRRRERDSTPLPPSHLCLHWSGRNRRQSWTT